GSAWESNYARGVENNERCRRLADLSRSYLPRSSHSGPLRPTETRCSWQNRGKGICPFVVEKRVSIFHFLFLGRVVAKEPRVRLRPALASGDISKLTLNALTGT